MFHKRKPYTADQTRPQRADKTVLLIVPVSLFWSTACSDKSPVEPAPTLEDEDDE